jgi:hypothetical protein
MEAKLLQRMASLKPFGRTGRWFKQVTETDMAIRRREWFRGMNLKLSPCRYPQSVVLLIGKVSSLSNCIVNEKFIVDIGTHQEG